MPHLIPDNAIERLSKLRGVSLDEYKRQLEQVDTKISDRLHDSVEASWQDCFPIWLEFGRVNDLSYRIPVPYYFPSYAQMLGARFAEVHRDDYAYLINLLRTVPIKSYEYLCAYDLLETITYEFYRVNQPVPKEIYGIDLPVPLVVYREKGWNNRFCGLESIGSFIHLSYSIEYGDSTLR